MITPFTLPPTLLILHPPSVGSRFAASGLTPSKSSTSTLDVATPLRLPPSDRKKIFFAQKDGARFPQAPAKRGPEETGGRKGPGESMPPSLLPLSTAPPISSRRKKFSSSASSSALTHSCWIETCVMLTSCLGEQVLFQSDRPDLDPPQDSTILERPGENREKAPLPLPAWLTVDDREQERENPDPPALPAWLREQDFRATG